MNHHTVSCLGIVEYSCKKKVQLKIVCYSKGGTMCTAYIQALWAPMKHMCTMIKIEASCDTNYIGRTIQNKTNNNQLADRLNY